MAPKVRDRIINALIMTASGSAVALLAFWLSANELNANELEQKLNDKLSTENYEKDQLLRWSNHDKIHNDVENDIKETKQMVRDIHNHLLKNFRN